MLKYKCKICGWVYDPQKGDIKNGIVPGIDFNQLPADWVCPICKASKEKFISQKSL
ncbi:MAG: rubredoxin [Spirochaetes bacterium GWF1_31_7]|nr:MAG: rubredoxin [Spirochaetes bacterium GWE1_32_154]OHD46933.1 MAG: rubredoxin [Spirochaetes bacterium GWF1_31_7]OHD48711.1 MAG: rubredoxin [Spirochaetes bacterium GWE2_31_10]OHD82600.1 MAG: rubredoxin [Spirochaetes bacterium RIFOXYB1_FULL_32_8]HBD95560.1 rubredoxin [Spirochaetia bacterium]